MQSVIDGEENTELGFVGKFMSYVKENSDNDSLKNFTISIRRQ